MLLNLADRLRGRYASRWRRWKPLSRGTPVETTLDGKGNGMKLRSRVVPTALLFTVAIVMPFVPPSPALATQVCGPSGTHTLCVTAPTDTLTGEQVISVTNTPNSGEVILTWVVNGKKVRLQTSFVPNPTAPRDYSFVWPTQKYLDGSGVLRAQFGSASAEPVDISVTLSNGNAQQFKHNPNDWKAFLPATWTSATDPVVAAVGDGASNENASNAVAASIVRANPALFFYLGDVYEDGTFTEYRNHYGISSMDVPGGGTLWGKIANITQPTFGNHEVTSRSAFTDYWHGRPMFTSFTFGGVLFLDLWSGRTAFAVGSEQYRFVQDQLASAPPCVVAVWHRPTLSGSTVHSEILPMWQLLANGGADLSLHGDAHYLAEYRPLNADLQPGTDAHMVQIIAGAGGHKLTAAKVDAARTAWPTSPQKISGAVYIRLVGAAGGRQATGLSWEFRSSTAAVLRQGMTTC